jgi:regulator of nonsense transcripts 2
MDVDFMLSDSLEASTDNAYFTCQVHSFNDQAVRPKLQMPRNIEEAALAVDEMYNSAYQAAG